MKKLVLITLLSLIITVGYAKTNIKVIHDTIRFSNDDRELKLYKMLYENARETNSSNYSVVFTIIAIVVAFIIFILGSQAFFNYRLNKRELENLKSDLKLEFSSELYKLQNEIQNIELKLVKDINDKTKVLEDKFIKLDKLSNQRIDIANASLNHLMAKNYNIEGSYGAALIHYIWACEAALDAELKITLGSSLDKLKEFVVPLTEISEYSSNYIKRLSDEIPLKYPTEFDAIIKDIKENIEKKMIIKEN